MAKKEIEPEVNCKDCKNSGEVVNFLTDCSDKKANPNGVKMGTYPRKCKQFKKK